MNENSPEDVSALLGDVNELVDNSHCHIDTSHIVSVSLRRAVALHIVILILMMHIVILNVQLNESSLDVCTG